MLLPVPREADAPTERAQPWLGTFVSIRVSGVSREEAHLGIQRAFDEVACVHKLMSFHDPDSDVTKLNRIANVEPVKVHPYTYAVLQQAHTLAERSAGVFDITTASELVEWKFLPRVHPPSANRSANWTDMELLPAGRVRFRRPLAIDLGGIAKGFAVDRAIESLQNSGVPQAAVNAGGDLRVYGDDVQRIVLDTSACGETAPALDLATGSVASSTGRLHQKVLNGRVFGPHVDGSSRTPAPTNRFVTVVADTCIVADALTKIVLAKARRSDRILRAFGAVAYLHEPVSGWRAIGLESQA